MDRIARLLRPDSIAVVGASTAQNKLAGMLIPTLLAGGYKGRIYPVNPRYAEVAGQRCYASLDEVPGPVDHCVIVVGRERIAEVLKACRRKGVAGASIFTSGFAEANEAGRQAQRELVELAGGMPFLGPNCMGFANLADGVLATTSSLLRSDPSGGDIAVLSQSGGIAFASLGYQARALGLRFSHMVNTGNTVGVSYTDLLAFLFGEERARVVIVAAESETVVGQVLAAVRQHGLRKPIVMLKLGRGETGVRMALSHTGSLAGDYRLIQGLCEQAGIVCVDDIDEALGAADMLRNGFTPAHTSGLAAICISGGNIALFADHADRTGVSFAPLTDATQAKLRARLPAYISVHNPIDITALGMEEPALYADVLRLAAADETVRVLVPILTSATDCTPMCRMLADLRAETGTPMITLWTGGSMEDRSPSILREAGIPIFRSSGLLARCLHQLRRADGGVADTVAAGTTPPKVQHPPRQGSLTESESLAFLESGGVPVSRWRVCRRVDLPNAAAEIGYPVVIKADSAETHISDRGAVILGVRDAEDLARRAAQIDGLPGETLLVSQFLPGEELIASTFTHPVFGPVLMVGSGGRLVELRPDVRFLGLPATRAQLERALTETAIGDALKRGFRGASGFEAAVTFLERLTALALATTDLVAQIELNPVTVGAHGAAAVDAAVIVREQAGGGV